MFYSFPLRSKESSFFYPAVIVSVHYDYSKKESIREFGIGERTIRYPKVEKTFKIALDNFNDSGN